MFAGIIESMRVVCISVKLDLAGFPGPTVLFHDSEGALYFSSDGDVVTLCSRGLWVGEQHALCVLTGGVCGYLVQHCQTSLGVYA